MIENEFRKLNDRGVKEFKTWLLKGGKGSLPKHLLETTKYSTPTDYIFSLELPTFSNRFEFGDYLVTLLRNVPSLEIENDINFWSTLSLIWFDSICNKNENGERNVQEISRYILKLDWHDYRHLVRAPWISVRLHGEHSKFLLMSIREESYPLSHFSFTFTQFGSRQLIFRNKRLIQLFHTLYFDKHRNVLREGLQDKKGGGPERTGTIFQQLALTYDIEQMSMEQILQLLPKEFDRWKEGVRLVELY